MPDTSFTFHSINARRGPEHMASLLHSSTADFLLVQEPWWGCIGTTHSDNDPDGVPTLGLTSGADLWNPFLPKLSDGEVPKVALYVKRAVTAHACVLNDTTHPAAWATCLILTVQSGDDMLQVMNYYHQMDDHRPTVSLLTSHSFDALTPTILVGDFNTHSPTWSMPDKLASRWAEGLEDWLKEQSFTLLSQPQVPTRTEEGHQPSVLDLLFVNHTAAWSDQAFFNFSSFSLSLGSDHALLSFSWATELTEPEFTDASSP